jgi:AcrR family transcriptional regulator
MRAPKQGTEIRKSQIARAVLEQIAECGLKGLNMAAVAQRVGVVPSALYRHYRGKEEILQAVFEQIGERLAENVRTVCDEHPGALDRLRALTTLNLQMLQDFPAIPRILFTEGVGSESTQRKAEIYEMIRRYLARVADIIQAGQRGGEIRPELDAQALAAIFWALIPPATVLWFVSEGRFDVRRHMERSWELFQEGIALPGGGSPKTKGLRNSGSAGAKSGSAGSVRRNGI